MYYDLAQTSLVKTPISLVEMYIPLWVYSSVNGSTSAAISAGVVFVQKGSTATVNTNGIPEKLHALNSAWASTQKFAFEVSIKEDTSGYIAYAALTDMSSSGTIVSGSQVSINTTTATVIRSSQFTLTPGHRYGISIWTSGVGNTLLNKAHLVAFLS